MKNLTLISIFLGVISIVFVFRFFDSQTGLPAYKDLKTKISAIKVRIDGVENKNRQLSAEIRVVKKDGKYVERLIKRDLFYVSEDETMYIFK